MGTLVALAYHLQKLPYVFPIVGGRKVEHLKANMESLTITLSTEQIKYLESILPFDLGFPMNVIVRSCLATIDYACSDADISIGCRR